MSLFAPDLPRGFHYQAEFIGPEDERALAEGIAGIEFSDFEMRGVVARRRVAFFGQSYNDQPAQPIPDFLMPIRLEIARWASVTPEAFAMALINEYTPGATIGWHRDAPQYDIIGGISLLSSCRMKLRPYVRPTNVRAGGRAAPRQTTHELVLQPRSGYLITGLARSGYEHSIPATNELRYSITFRTLR